MTEWQRLSSGLLVPAEPPRPTAVDLFCGCGGFSLGLIESGYRVLAGVDNDCHAAETYMVNLGAYPIDLRFADQDDRGRLEKHLKRRFRKKGVSGFSVSGSNRTDHRTAVPTFWFGDVRKITGAQILESIGLERGELDLLVGGPPCQGYSMAGKRNVMDPRNSLVFEFARLVCEVRPKALAMENVPGILSMVTETGAPVIDELARILEAGDFGAYDAMRSVLSGGKATVVSQGAGVRQTRAKPQDDRQASLFGD